MGETLREKVFKPGVRVGVFLLLIGGEVCYRRRWVGSRARRVGAVTSGEGWGGGGPNELLLLA